MSAPRTEWAEANSAYLRARLALVHERLIRLCEADRANEAPRTSADAIDEMAVRTAEGMSPEPALDALCRAFGLSPFERDVLLVCAGVEIDEEFRRLCRTAQPQTPRGYPTFTLAFTALDGAHWSAVTPTGPLRHWRLIEVAAGEPLMASELRLDERVLHFLVGAASLDDRLRGVVQLVRPPSRLPASYLAPAEHIVDRWTARTGGLPVLHVCGEVGGDARVVASAACHAMGLQLYALRATDVPAALHEREAIARLWQREAVLGRGALLIECEDADPVALRQAQAFAERLDGPLFVTGAAWPHTGRMASERLELPLPTAHEQRTLWRDALGPLAERLNGQLDAVVSQFRLDADGIQSASRAIKDADPADPAALGSALWDACRGLARGSLDALAQRIDARARWEDLVLPDQQQQMLREIVAHVRQRLTVYESWGFAAQSARGLGISALFSGPSGTGKTLAAEMLARELRLDLYRIDLSQVVSKYIGETEKSLRRVFDAAEQSGAVLLFDEADALFGKRSEVRDSHDRYANIEVCYLLQRMESYRGLALLASNAPRSAFDPSLLRRLRFVVTFPFPDAAQRARIWQRIFPPETPTDGLDLHQLARLNVTGGNIRNIALNAAFLAADLGEPVRMSHLLRTAKSECAKLDKAATAAELGGWV